MRRKLYSDESVTLTQQLSVQPGIKASLVQFTRVELVISGPQSVTFIFEVTGALYSYCPPPDFWHSSSRLLVAGASHGHSSP